MDVSSVSSATNGQYFLRSRNDVQAGAPQPPQILGRTDRVEFSDRFQQIARGVADVAGAINGKEAGGVAKHPAIPGYGQAPGADPAAPQPVEAQQVTYGQADLDALIKAFGSTEESDSYDAGYDLNADGIIDSQDLNQLLANFVAGPGE